MEHNRRIAALTSSGGINTYQISFNWTAPAKGIGTVRFYAMFNAANNNHSESGDQPNAAPFSEYDEAASASVGALSFGTLAIFPNPANNNLLFHLDNKRSQSVSVHVFDMTGKLAYSENVTAVNGDAITDIW